jgi:sigma-B regulation protein RsbU (phosphoserine phosphatase)
VDLAELAERPDTPLRADQVASLQAQGIDVLLPLAPRGESRGLMALGFGDGYREVRAQELELIAHIGARTVLEDDNLRLRQEALERRRLQEQLAMARSVQRRFLPAELPDTPGLVLAAVCRPCLEVAGDTYDVLALPGSRTLISIADVSGKGAGAAMIMANVQASVRALAGAGQGPAAIAAHLNDLLVRSTSPEQFATLFLAMYDPGAATLRFVNAGHEPPLLRRAHGALETLSTGGTVVGAIADLPYTEGQARLEAGDLLLAYTDGITEAARPDGEMFGDDRLRTAVAASPAREPGELLAEIEAVVARFRAGREPDDDVTLLAARAHPEAP